MQADHDSTCAERGAECSLPMLARTAKAIHALFYATEEAGARLKTLRSSLTTDEELAAFQALGIGLINFDPPPPELIAGLRTKVEEIERRDAHPTPPSDRIAIDVNNDEDARYAKRLLERMYARWEGTLDFESGRHRFVFFSQADEECRRHTVFAHVSVDDVCPDLAARTYVLGPYLLVRDERTGRESDDPWAVLHGDLTSILPEKPPA